MKLTICLLALGGIAAMALPVLVSRTIKQVSTKHSSRIMGSFPHAMLIASD